MPSPAKTGIAVTKASELISIRGSPYSGVAFRWWLTTLAAAATMTSEQLEQQTGTLPR